MNLLDLNDNDVERQAIAATRQLARSTVTSTILNKVASVPLVLIQYRYSCVVQRDLFLGSTWRSLKYLARQKRTGSNKGDSRILSSLVAHA